MDEVIGDAMVDRETGRRPPTGIELRTRFLLLAMQFILEKYFLHSRLFFIIEITFINIALLESD